MLQRAARGRLARRQAADRLAEKERGGARCVDLLGQSHGVEVFEKVVMRHLQMGRVMWRVYEDVCAAYMHEDDATIAREEERHTRVLAAVNKHEALQGEAALEIVRVTATPLELLVPPASVSPAGVRAADSPERGSKFERAQTRALPERSSPPTTKGMHRRQQTTHYTPPQEGASLPQGGGKRISRGLMAAAAAGDEAEGAPAESREEQLKAIKFNPRVALELELIDLLEIGTSADVELREAEAAEAEAEARGAAAVRLQAAWRMRAARRQLQQSVGAATAIQAEQRRMHAQLQLWEARPISPDLP